MIFHKEVKLFTYIRVSNIEKHFIFAWYCFYRRVCPNGNYTAIMLVKKIVA